MVGVGTLLVSIVVLALAVLGLRYNITVGNRLGLVLLVDAAVISALGILLNFSTRGEATTVDVLVFDALPVGFIIIGVALSRFRPTVDVSYDRTDRGSGQQTRL